MPVAVAGSVPAVAYPSAGLRRLLRINAALSSCSGAIGLIGARRAAEFLGIDQTWIIVALGAGLVGFAVAVAAVSLIGTRTLLPSSQVISTGDMGWVAGTIAAIGLGWLSNQGAVVMGLIGMVVLGLGLAQLRARRSLILAVDEKHDHGTWLR